MSVQHNNEFQVRLSLLQVVFLLGLILGCLVAVYAAGYVSGDGSGYERAMRSSVKNFIPFAIEEEQKVSEKELQEKSTEIYARLQEKPGKRDEQGLTEKDIPGREQKSGESEDGMPEIAKIEESKSKPLPLEKKDPEQDLAGDGEENTTVSAIAALTGDPGPAERQGEAPTITQEEGAGEARLSEILAKSSAQGSALHEEQQNSITEQNNIAEKNSVREGSGLGDIVARGASAEKQPMLVEQASPSPKPTQALVTPGNVASGWYAQVAAPSTLAEASALSAKLRSSGFPVRIETASVRGQQYYRVLVGPESSQTYAQRLVGQLKREPGIRSEPFVKYVP